MFVEVFFVSFFGRNSKGGLRHNVFTEGKLRCCHCLCTAAKPHLENFIVHPKWNKTLTSICQSAVKGQESSPPELICWSYLNPLAIIQIIISPLLKLLTFGWCVSKASGRITVTPGVSVPAFSRWQNRSVSHSLGCFSWGFLLIFQQLNFTHSYHAQEPASMLSS